MTLSLPDICSHYGGLLSRDGYRRCRLPSMLGVTTGWLNAAGPSALSCASISTSGLVYSPGWLLVVGLTQIGRLDHREG